jgi:hypothetical protein
MGDIGPVRQHYEVLAVPQVGPDDIDAWTAPPRVTVPTPGPMPVPHPEPVPEPIPDPGPQPDPSPDPAPVPKSGEGDR